MRLATQFGVLAALAALATTASAQVLAYDMETSLSGFGPNGGGVTISADTIGATNGPTSLKMSVVTGATFVGALTGNVAPAFYNPAGVDSIIFDLTITDPIPSGFVAVGVTVFGASQPDFPGGQLFGLQAQFADFVAVEGLAVGTHTITLDLASATHPITFATGQSYKDIFGDFGTGSNDLIPTGFQFFLNKSNTIPATIYIDNVRTLSIPEPATLGLLAFGLMGGLGVRRR